MAKNSKKPTTPKVAIPVEIKNEATHMVKNGMTEAIMGFQPGAMGVQLSQADTLFKNLRWYLVSNMRQLLSQSYVEHGLIQTVMDVPVDDAFRGGVTFISKQLGEENAKQLKTEMDQDDDINVFVQAQKWTRLYGGGGVLIMTDQDPINPLDIGALKQGDKVDFRDVDMWELFWTQQNTGDYSAAIDQNDLNNVEYYDYYGQRVHHSRVIQLKGRRAPSFIRPRLRGWGFSEMEALVRSINQYLKANNLTFEVLDEFKLDVFKIKDLAATLQSPDGTAIVQQRVQLANMQKNYQNALTMDKEDDYDHKQLSFAGLSEAQIGIRMQLASDMRMPLTKLFGVSAAGFSSGEDDIENYNAMVEGQIRAKSRRGVLKMAAIKCQTMFGMIPDDLAFEFQPLRVLSLEQEENVKSQKFNRLLSAKQAGEITSLEFREGCNKENLLTVQLDTSEQALGELESGEGDNDTGEGNDDVGAAKPKGAAPKAAPKSTMTAKTAKNEDEAALVNEFENLSYNDFEHYCKVANPGKPDEGLWTKAKDASQKAFGKERWPFITWWYEKHGGKF